MSIEDLKIIDHISIDLEGNTVLTISDHLEWDEDNEHLVLLQEKINVYLSFIESGQLYEEYPNTNGRKIIINLIARYVPNQDGNSFINLIQQGLKSAGYGFAFSVLSV